MAFLPMKSFLTAIATLVVGAILYFFKRLVEVRREMAKFVCRPPWLLESFPVLTSIPSRHRLPRSGSAIFQSQRIANSIFHPICTHTPGVII